MGEKTVWKINKQELSSRIRDRRSDPGQGISRRVLDADRRSKKSNLGARGDQIRDWARNRVRESSVVCQHMQHAWKLLYHQIQGKAAGWEIPEKGPWKLWAVPVLDKQNARWGNRGYYNKLSVSKHRHLKREARFHPGERDHAFAEHPLSTASSWLVRW